MPSVKSQLEPAPAKCLFVFLPGAGDQASDFVKYGFFEAVRSRGLSADLVAANATIGYYNTGVAAARVHEDVVVPVKAGRSYEQTWVVGMSMGGMGTLLYSHEHEAEVTGLFALAPFLGSGVAQEVERAGGLRAWKAPEKVEKMTSANYQREIWRWLQEVTARGTPQLYLGWGTEDRLGESASVLAAALPKERVFNVPGPHKWEPWRKLWERFLDETPIKQACAP